MKKFNIMTSLLNSFCSLFLFVTSCLSGQVSSSIDCWDCVSGEKFCIREFQIPLEEDRYDGVLDGVEKHWFPNDLSGFRNSMMKVEKVTESCDNQTYSTVLMEEFEGTEVNLDRWIKGFNGNTPVMDIVGDKRFTTWAYPEFVEVKNGFLYLNIAPIEDPSRWTITFPDADNNGELISQQRFYGGGTITTNNRNPSSNDNSGCLRFGKYTIKAILPNPGAIAAYWFYGWPGEVDLFEMCSPNCNELQYTVHQWNYRPCLFGKNQFRLLNDALEGCSRDHFSKFIDSSVPTNAFSEFNTYTFEWTPYKMVWYVNDQEKLSFYRYYKIEGFPCSIAGIQIRGLECDEIPKNQILENVWETLGWNRFAIFSMDLILGTGLDKIDDEPGLQSLVVDWIKFEQKIGQVGVLGPNNGICLEQETAFTFEWDDLSQGQVTWRYSDNLQIINQNNNNIVIKPSSSGSSFVEAEVDNPMSCIDMRFRKNFFSGLPQSIPISVQYLPCQGYFINAQVDENVGEKTWKITLPGGEYYEEYNKNSIFVASPRPINAPKSYGQFEFTITNDCGTTSRYGSLVFDPCPLIELKVAPNPANSIVLFELKKDGLIFNSGAQMLTFKLFNENMNVIQTKQLLNSVGEFDLTYLQTGDYYISTEIDGQGVISTKIIKQ